MTMKHNLSLLHSIAAMLLLTATLSSCGDFLEESSQDKDYVRSWTDLDELLVGDCYLPVGTTQAYNSYANLGTFVHVLADEIEENASGSSDSDLIVGSHGELFGAMTWQPHLGDSENNTIRYTENIDWKKLYKYINVANNILASASDVSQSNDEEIEGLKKVTGEAYFLRAFYYFWLVNVYARPYDPATAAADPGVPLKTSPEVEDVIFQRNSVQEVYDQIVADLERAERQLSEVTSFAHRLYQADLTAVNLLQSRVFLYTQQWQLAADYARKVIDRHPELENLNTTSAKFMVASNPENIFSMSGDDLPRMMDRAHQATRISLDLYNAYSINDLRKSQWFWHFGTFTGLIRREQGKSTSDYTPSDEYWYTDVYHLNISGVRSPVSSMFWLRSAEAYMNLAEAEAYLGHEQQARTALGTVLQNRYYPGCQELQLQESGSDLISRIRNERRLEFPAEGHRWFDLRRYRVCAVQPEKVSLAHTYTVYRDGSTGHIVETRRYVLTEDDASWTVNIPFEVLQFNTGMPDNGNQARPYTIVPTPQ